MGGLHHEPPRRAPRLGRHQRQIAKLARLVADRAPGYAPNTLYLIGEFKTRNGAYETIRRFMRKPESLPVAPGVTVTLEHRLVNREDGTRGSELWAGIVEHDVEHDDE